MGTGRRSAADEDVCCPGRESVSASIWRSAGMCRVPAAEVVAPRFPGVCRSGIASENMPTLKFSRRIVIRIQPIRANRIISMITTVLFPDQNNILTERNLEKTLNCAGNGNNPAVVSADGAGFYGLGFEKAILDPPGGDAQQVEVPCPFDDKTGRGTLRHERRQRVAAEVAECSVHRAH